MNEQRKDLVESIVVWIIASFVGSSIGLLLAFWIADL